MVIQSGLLILCKVLCHHLCVIVRLSFRMLSWGWLSGVGLCLLWRGGGCGVVGGAMGS